MRNAPASPSRTEVLLRIGTFVRERRRALKMNREQLAAVSGLSYSLIGLIERHGSISKASAERLAAVLKVRAEELQP